MGVALVAYVRDWEAFAAAGPVALGTAHPLSCDTFVSDDASHGAASHVTEPLERSHLQRLFWLSMPRPRLHVGLGGGGNRA